MMHPRKRCLLRSGGTLAAAGVTERASAFSRLRLARLLSCCCLRRWPLLLLGSSGRGRHLTRRMHLRRCPAQLRGRESRSTGGLELALAAWPRHAGIFERPLGDAVRFLSLSFSEHPPVAVLNHGDAVHGDSVGGAVFSPDGKRILSWSSDKTLRLWEAATGAAIDAPMRHEDFVKGARYSPDGKRILSWSEDKTVRQWDATTGAAIGEPLRHGARVIGAAYSADGKRIVSRSDDKTPRLWDPTTGAAIGAPMRHEAAVWGAVYSPDGKRIMSWSEDKTLRQWDALMGSAIGERLRHDKVVRGAIYFY